MSEVKEPSYMRERKIMLKYIKNGSREILYIGTGACACLAIVLAQQGYRIIAIDNNQSALAEARKKVKESGFDSRINFKLGDATSLSFSDGSFANILAYASLHHVQDIEKAVSEIYRMLSPKGRAIIGDFNESDKDHLNKLQNLLKSRFRWDEKLNARTVAYSSVEKPKI